MKSILIFFTTLLLFCSCSLGELPKEVQESVVTIHSIDDVGIKSRLVVPVFINGQELLISKLPVLTNRDIMYCETFQYREDQYGLIFDLTDRGRLAWQQASVEFRGLKGAMLVGGRFKCFVLFSRDVGGAKAKVAAPLTQEEAEKIAKDIARNYEAIKEQP